ncbi:response regulator transcription factor [Bifidobacterium sp. LC6]|uniref:Response regulator transcription factor n=1 Tax=Bifidobacterium colobi TaxID=2809026 RepID=A0ABS5UWS7_9BIFI|nr:response regulator transcription factor [Bifidobacterium colobi]MBT1175581.1 response regulator transcription factor [Bifidobacterium colobi]
MSGIENVAAGTAVAVLDNDSMALERLCAVLPKLLPGLSIIWSTTSAPESLRRCLDDGWRPDLLIADVELDGTTAMAVCRQIRLAGAKPSVLATSSYNPKTYAQQLAEAGAQGLMVKGNMAQMAVALRAVAGGTTFSPIPDVAFLTASEAYQHMHLHEQDFSLPSANAVAHNVGNENISALSALEQRILSAVSEGYSNEEIADSLSISTATVRSHTRHIREKLGAKTLSHAVAIWLKSR